MELIKANIGKTYFDPSLKGKEVIIANSNWSPHPHGVLTGNVEIQSNAGEPEEMYETVGIDGDDYGYVWTWILIFE